jgi:hypothetical protein
MQKFFVFFCVGVGGSFAQKPPESRDIRTGEEKKKRGGTLKIRRKISFITVAQNIATGLHLPPSFR